MKAVNLEEFTANLEAMSTVALESFADRVLNELLSRYDHGLLALGSNGQEFHIEHVVDDTPDELYKETKFTFVNASVGWLGNAARIV